MRHPTENYWWWWGRGQDIFLGCRFVVVVGRNKLKQTFVVVVVVRCECDGTFLFSNGRRQRCEFSYH